MTSVAAARTPFGASRVRPALSLRLRRRGLPWLLLAPSLLLLAAFTYLPIVRVAWDSLYDKPHGTARTLFVGLGNYAALFPTRPSPSRSSTT
jgi:ABC-type sugar transport system permease subunit